jgi:hypothetical protein
VRHSIEKVRMHAQVATDDDQKREREQRRNWMDPDLQGFPPRQIDFAVLQTWMRETVKEIKKERTKHPRTGSN